MAERRSPMMRPVSPVRRKRARLLGKTKMQRDRIVQAIHHAKNDSQIDSDEVLRLQRLLKNTQARVTALKDVAVDRPTAKQV